MAMTSKVYFSFSYIFLVFLFVLPVLSHVPKELLENNTNSSPFGFLKDLQGCHKGDKVKGIHDLKLYLTHFGYLNYQNNLNATNPNEDTFDEELEKAIKSYQGYHHLSSTGTLDEQTVSIMAMPRCGVPDIEQEPHRHRDGSLHTVSHYQFFRGRPRWGKRHLTYAYGSRFPTQFMPPVARAFKKWDTASQYFTFTRVRSYRSADLKISFARGDHGDGFPFDGPRGVLAHAFAPTRGLFHFDADEAWVVGAVPNGIDVETLALHEIGHLLGLNHSQYEDAIMWTGFRAGETKGLHSDDIQGIRALYGS